MRGRKPLPNELKVLTGQRVRGSRGTNSGGGKPTCPDFLDDAAKAEWKRVVSRLDELGILGTIDRAALAAYCVAYSRWLAAEEKVQRFGTVMQGRDGGMFQNPYLAVANRAMEQMVRLAAEFGMTPSARTRVKGAEQAPAPRLMSRTRGA